ncbi:MAG: hypothetical protein R3F55_02785 [Alphaproteobacteria bacterium]
MPRPVGRRGGRARQLIVAFAAFAAALTPALQAPRASTPAGDVGAATGAAGPADETYEPPTPEVRGFRSAGFGMDESQVRRAIADDFGLDGADVRLVRNDLEQTTVLSVAVEGLVPEAGPARIGYVLGRGGRLIQVTVLWGVDPAATDRAGLESAAALLIAYFDEQGFASQTGATPVVFADGSNLLYYASDEQGGGLALSVEPRRAADAAAMPILRLAYVASRNNPAVFRTPAIAP